MGFPSKVCRRLERDGFSATAAAGHAFVRYRFHAWWDDAMDRLHGFDTAGIVEPDDVDHVGENGAHSTGHEPIQRRVFDQMLRFAPVDYPRFTFVDFGSGKGRAVLLAAHFPFRKVVGIEFSPTLHRAAQRNVSRFRAARSTATQIDLRCEDAALSVLPETPLLCFFYNPFGEVVMRKVLQNLEQWAGSRRALRILYRSPFCSALMDGSGFLALKTATPEFRIYENHC